MRETGHLHNEGGEIHVGAGGMRFTRRPQCCLTRTNGLPYLVVAAHGARARHNYEELVHGSGMSANLPAGGDPQDRDGDLLGPHQGLR